MLQSFVVSMTFTPLLSPDISTSARMDVRKPVVECQQSVGVRVRTRPRRGLRWLELGYRAREVVARAEQRRRYDQREVGVCNARMLAQRLARRSSGA